MLLFLIIWMLTGGFGLLVLLNYLWPAGMNIFAQFLYFAPVLVYLLIKGVRPGNWIPFRGIRISTILLTVLVTFLFMPLTSFLNLLSMLFSTNFVSESAGEMAANPIWLNLLKVAVIPALLEELVFRGVFYHAYREKGVLVGALASAVAFGLMHMNFNQFFYAFVLGLIFCMLIEITGSIFTTIIAHFVVNGWSVLLTTISGWLGQMAGSSGETANQTLTNNDIIAALGVYGAMAVICSSMAVCLMIWMAKRSGRMEHLKWCFRRHPLPIGVRRHFVTPAFVIAAVVAVAYMVLIELRF